MDEVKKTDTLTVNQVAKELNIAPHVIRAGIRNGAFPFGKAEPGKEHTEYIITREAFEAWKRRLAKDKR